MDYTQISLEGAGILLIIVVAYKLYKMRINSSSHCCGENIQLETYNSGGEELKF